MAFTGFSKEFVTQKNSATSAGGDHMHFAPRLWLKFREPNFLEA